MLWLLLPNPPNDSSRRSKSQISVAQSALRLLASPVRQRRAYLQADDYDLALRLGIPLPQLNAHFSRYSAGLLLSAHPKQCEISMPSPA
jgi:hypothetical protein